MKLCPHKIFIPIVNNCMYTAYRYSKFSLTKDVSIEKKHEVTMLNGLNEFCVKFYGPKGSKYHIPCE